LNRIKEEVQTRVVNQPNVGPKYAKPSETSQYIDFTNLIRTLKEQLNYYRDLRSSLNGLMSYFTKLNDEPDTGRIEGIKNLDNIVDNILNTKVRPLALNEKLTVDESQIIEYKLNKFVLEVLNDKPVPARLYIVGKDSVEFKIRTKQIVKQLQNELDDYKKRTPAKVLERLLEEMSNNLAKLQAIRQQELYVQNLVRKK
jgi:hypothetical protein